MLNAKETKIPTLSDHIRQKISRSEKHLKDFHILTGEAIEKKIIFESIRLFEHIEIENYTESE